MRLIDADALDFTFPMPDDFNSLMKQIGIGMAKSRVDNAPTIEAAPVGYDWEAEERELRKQVAWLKSCINCGIRNNCPRHCGKVVHDCDHWQFGDPVVHGYWIEVFGRKYGNSLGMQCSECGRRVRNRGENYCPKCGAKMDRTEVL